MRPDKTGCRCYDETTLPCPVHQKGIDKEGWFDVAKKFKPEMDEEEFDKLWDEFIVYMKQQRMH